MTDRRRPKRKLPKMRIDKSVTNKGYRAYDGMLNKAEIHIGHLTGTETYSYAVRRNGRVIGQGHARSFEKAKEDSAKIAEE